MRAFLLLTDLVSGVIGSSQGVESDFEASLSFWLWKGVGTGGIFVSGHPLLTGLAEQHRTLFNTLREQATKVIEEAGLRSGC